MIPCNNINATPNLKGILVTKFIQCDIKNCCSKYIRIIETKRNEIITFSFRRSKFMLNICSPVNSQMVKISSESQTAIDSIIRKQMFDRNSGKTMNTLKVTSNLIESYKVKFVKINERKKRKME